MLIYLADLTYTQQTISSDIMPNAIGGIATYSSGKLGNAVQFRIFKTPAKLIQALLSEPPDVIGFSNYAWNFNISYTFAEEIKKRRPETTIVFGGPNYPLDDADREQFLKNQPAIDYYVVGEGELVFCNLIRLLLSADTRPQIEAEVASVHYYSKKKGKAVFNEYEKRLSDLSEIPSPYVAGILDEFFDGNFLPIVQAGRGCPFSCTFCCEGTEYYNKVVRKSQEQLRNELFYIAEHMKPVVRNGGRADLHIADTNFGMYESDYDTCKIIRECRDRYGWPAYVNVPTGKNKKDRVLKAASLLEGSLRIAGSVQSMDDTVLANIKRKNISKNQMIQLAIESSKLDANSYSELILGLPGETKESHFKGIADIINMGFNFVSLYTLMLLPGSEMYSNSYRKKFGFVTQYRVIPRCFGSFDFSGSSLVAGEIEEVVVETNTLSFEEYLQCRKMHLIVVLFYNDKLFSLIHDLLKNEGVAVFDFLYRIYISRFPSNLSVLFRHFESETRSELWDEKEELKRFLLRHIQNYLSGAYGSNLLFKYKSLGIVNYIREMGELAAFAAIDLLQEKLGALNDLQKRFVLEAAEYCVGQTTNLFELSQDTVRMVSHFNYESIVEENKFSTLNEKDAFANPRHIIFRHTDE